MSETNESNFATLHSIFDVRAVPQNLMKPMSNRNSYIVNVGHNPKTHEKMLRSLVHDKRRVDVMRRCAPMVQKYMEAVIHSRDLQNCLSDKDYLATIEDAWYNLLADFMHLYNPSGDATKCSSQCLKQRTTICLDPSRHVYGCWMHGYLHICQRTTRCFVVQTNHDLSLTCVLSGRPLGFTQGDDCSYRQAGGSKKNQFDYYKMMQRHQNIRDTSTNEATSDAARIARETGRYHHTQIPDVVAHLEEAAAEKQLAEEERSAVYKKLTESIEREDSSPAISLTLARDDITPPPSGIPPHPKPYEAKKADVKFGAAVDLNAEEAARQQDALFQSITRFALISSSSAAQALAGQAMRIGNRIIRTVILEVYEDLHRPENRVLYNVYRRHCAAHVAQMNVRDMFTRALRDGKLVQMPDVWIELDSHNREFVDLVPKLDRDATYTEKIISNIHWLWDVCNRSPHAERHVVKNEETGATTMAMSGSDGACSLRQFALACMYYMREGLIVDVPYSYTREKKMILAPQHSLMADLPSDETHVRYFGAEAMAELKRCIDNGLFSDTDAEYNLNRVEQSLSTTKGGAFKRNRTNSSGMNNHNEEAVKRRRGAIKTSKAGDEEIDADAMPVALANSIAIEQGAMEIAVAKKRKSTARKGFDSEIVAERGENSNGRMQIRSNADGTTTTLTEQQCTPFYMREPLLTSGTAQHTRRGVYSAADIANGRRYIMLALNSYEHRISDLK